MKLFKIAKSNIRKNISISISLVVLVIIATILLYVGSSVILDINSFIDDKNKELNGSDFSIVSPKSYEEQVKEILSDLGRYEMLEAEAIIVKTSSDVQNITLQDKVQTIGCIFLNADLNAEISRLKIIDEGSKKQSNSIILPHFLKIAKGYRTGDELTISNGSKVSHYIIYGFAEDVMFASPSNVSIYKCYLFSEEFNRLYREESDMNKGVLFKTKLKNGEDSALYSADFVKLENEVLGDSALNSMTLDYSTLRIGVSVFLVIMMATLIVFSFIIIMIALTVMRFSIVTHIESNMKNIGSMEAMGFTGKQLIAATVIQFMFITVIGCTIGFMIAFLSTDIITNIVSSSIGLRWDSKINLLAITISLMVVLVCVISITYSTARKIKKITPIMALRSGIDTHNFKKNHLPVSKSVLNVNVLIGLKSFLLNTKQNITIFIIVILMSFVCVFAFTANYNFNVDNTAFLRLLGVEKSHLSVLYLEEGALSAFREIKEMEHVDKTLRLTEINMALSKGERELTPQFTVCNDYSLKEINTVVKGRYPIHDNEIAVTGVVLRLLNAQLGDIVTIKGKDKSLDFIIVGVTQQISQLGKGASITEEGMLRLNVGFQPTMLYIYLDHKDNIFSVMSLLETKYGDQVQIINTDEILQTLLVAFNSSVKVLSLVCIVITIVIISLILYLLIKIRIIKERTRIGLSKALGYTTKQLILQLVISFCPVCILGAFIGTALAMYLINPAFAALLSFSGIVNSNLIINPMLTIITFAAISFFSLLITALVSLRLMKITPYELFI